MTKEELAEQYANEKAAEFTQAIKEAYIKGYEQGKTQTATTIQVDGVEYIDLGLPSGLLWGKVNDYLTYAEAKYLNLPTIEQLEELSSCVGLKRYDRNTNASLGDIVAEIQLVAKNGNRINGFYYYTRTNYSGAGPYIWIKGVEENDNHMINAGYWYLMSPFPTIRNVEGPISSREISSREPHLTLLVLNPSKL